MVAMSKSSTKNHLLRVDKYVNPGHHDPTGGGPVPYNPTKSVLPSNHVELFTSSTAVRNPKNGTVTRWAKEGEGRDAVYHRFQESSPNEFHWNGSTKGRTKSGEAREIALHEVPGSIRNG